MSTRRGLLRRRSSSSSSPFSSSSEGPAQRLDDEQAVASAYAAHGAEIYRFVLRGLRDPGAAQDVVQETFLRAWRAGDKYDPELSSLRVWLFAIARNTMLDAVRAAKVRPWESLVVDDEQIHAAASPVEDDTEALVRGWVVQEALQRLSEEHRLVLVETYLKERPYAEVAAELGVPAGTVRSRVYYGLRALRVAMDEMGVQL